MIEPINDFILIKQKEKEGKIMLSDTNEKCENEFEVIAISEEIRIPKVIIGGTIIKGQYSGDLVKVDGEEYFLIKQEHILAIKK